MAICNLKKKSESLKVCVSSLCKRYFSPITRNKKTQENQDGKALGDSLNHDKNTRQVIIKISKISTCRCGEDRKSVV